MRLLPLSAFDTLFDPLRGQRLGLVDGFGNAGDRLLQRATRQLLTAFGCDWRVVVPAVDCAATVRENCDRLLLPAGGWMGHAVGRDLRQAAYAYGLPCTVLPQSFMAAESLPADTVVYVREPASRKYCPSARLCPDLALAYDFPEPSPATAPAALFLRTAEPSLFSHLLRTDPAADCYGPDEYINRVSPYASVTTDRLHLAIIALGLGREATLLPVTYHKNRSMWETWLQQLGCRWADSPAAVAVYHTS